MALTIFTAGTDAKASEVNVNFNEALNIGGKNLIRSTILAAQTMTTTAQDDWFAEAYIDADGRNNLVDTTNMDSVFDTNKYKCAASLAEYNYIDIYASSVNTATLTDVANKLFCVQIGSGVWRLSCSKTSSTEALKRIFTALFYGLTAGVTTPNGVTGLTALRCSDPTYRGMKVRYIQYSSGGATFGASPKTRTYTLNAGNFYVMSDYQQWAASGGGSVAFQIDGNTIHSGSGGSGSTDDKNTGNIHGGTSTMKSSSSETSPSTTTLNSYVVVAYTTTSTFTGSGDGTEAVASGNIEISATAPDTSTYPSSSIIYHNIPSGNFNSAISSAYLTPLIANWESGADIQYKLQNGSEDSGWLSCSNSTSISNFTAFTSEPTILIVKLIPKSSSPTPGYPAIYGVALRCV